MQQDYYKVLGVSKKASQQEIDEAYRRLVRENHPDLHPGDKQKEETLRRVNEAYQVLGNPTKRKEYDELLAGAAQPKVSSPASAKNQPANSRLGAIYSTMMAGRAAATPTASHKRSSGRLEIWITEEEAHRGGVKTLSVGDQTITVPIRPGIKDKETVMLPVVIRIARR
jgi:DnaJ-class molecular chaperone